MAEAEEALRSAAKQYGGFGWYLPEGKPASTPMDMCVPLMLQH
jgi:hypothetical protein